MLELGNPVKAHRILPAYWDKLGDVRKSLSEKTPDGPFRIRIPIHARVGEIMSYHPKRGVLIGIDPPIMKGEAPKLARNFFPIYGVPMFTFTSKMSAPSFSIQAGPIKFGGACPAANIPKERWVDIGRQVEVEGGFSDIPALLSGRRRQEGERSVPADAANGLYICDLCYAGKGNYVMYDNNSLYQIVRKIWTDRAVARGSFAIEITEAIKATMTGAPWPKKKLVSRTHFRIHDAGDFFSIPYFLEWIQVCRNLPGVLFWAPTRMWAVSAEWRKVMADAVLAVKNLSLRPSALVYGSQAPMVAGLSSGSTSSPSSMQAVNHWDCPAYQSDEGSCASAGCRTCWDRPEIPVSYKTH